MSTHGPSINKNLLRSIISKIDSETYIGGSYALKEYLVTNNKLPHISRNIEPNDIDTFINVNNIESFNVIAFNFIKELGSSVVITGYYNHNMPKIVDILESRGNESFHENIFATLSINITFSKFDLENSTVSTKPGLPGLNLDLLPDIMDIIYNYINITQYFTELSASYKQRQRQRHRYGQEIDDNSMDIVPDTHSIKFQLVGIGFHTRFTDIYRLPQALFEDHLLSILDIPACVIFNEQVDDDGVVTTNFYVSRKGRQILETGVGSVEGICPYRKQKYEARGFIFLAPKDL